MPITAGKQGYDKLFKFSRLHLVSAIVTLSTPRLSSASSFLTYNKNQHSLSGFAQWNPKNYHHQHRIQRPFSQFPSNPIMTSLNEKSNNNEGITVLERSPQLSSRIHETLDPCVVLMKSLISKYNHLWEDKGGIQSLAQGVVYWTPPPSSFESIAKAAQLASESPMETDLHMYGPEIGIPELVSRLEEKLKIENGLDNVSVMVTSGANQAYINCVLTLLEEGTDKGIIFSPYYFNHVMAMQMSRGDDSILIGPTTGSTGIPDLDWLTATLNEKGESIKMITIVNPGNPTGVSIPREILNKIINLCEKHNVWLVMDNTYEHFEHSRLGASVNDSTALPFECSKSSNVINIFSFSKGYSFAGFRVGYLTVSKDGNGPEMFQQMLKVQDTIPICVSRISQIAAIGALDAGREWVNEKVSTLEIGRSAILEALSPLETIMGGSGAMYVMGKLPDGIDDQIAANTLVKDFGIAIIPGSFCGYPGWIRVCYSNLPPDQCKVAAKRLSDGIQAIVEEHK